MVFFSKRNKSLQDPAFEGLVWMGDIYSIRAMGLLILMRVRGPTSLPVCYRSRENRFAQDRISSYNAPV